MRLRNIPGSREIIASSDYVIHENVMRDKKCCWADVFGNDAPLFLEIGMGKGRFISELAQREPCHNFVGIEKYSSVLLRAIQRREALEQKTHLTNLLYLRMEAEDLTDVFGPGEVAGIYLNFSDPWPKDRHAKRRLTSDRFLERYAAVLTRGGTVAFKTDNTALFGYSLETAAACGWEILSCTRDLHADPVLSAGTVMTEYEEKFSAQGSPICRMVIRRP